VEVSLPFLIDSGYWCRFVWQESVMTYGISAWGAEKLGAVEGLCLAVEQVGGRLVDAQALAAGGRIFVSLVAELQDLAAAREALQAAAQRCGLEVTVEPREVAAQESAAGEGLRWEVTAIGATAPLPLGSLAKVLTDAGARIERIRGLSETGLRVAQVSVALPEAAAAEALRRALIERAALEGFDVGLQRRSVHRKSKRLVVMDMDSTLISIEVIDELARAHGVYDRVAAITERAMRGELDFRQSLRERVALLRGLDAGVLHELAGRLPLNDGAERLCATLRRLGFRLAVISGGFSDAAEALQRRLGLDHAFANRLGVAEGRLTGEVVGTIVDAERKAALLGELAASEGISLDQVIAVGDGANDLPMLRKAGLGVAFRAKPAVRAEADVAFSHSGLDAILYLIGLSEAEICELEVPPSGV
jgi:phosphoserine phosphatase